MAANPIILFDLPSKDRCHCWSLNPWKPRLILNYKNIPYTTEFVEYPDIAAKFAGYGIKPNESGHEYTIPAVKFPDGTYVMDSVAIAAELEKRYPSPSLHLDSSKLQQLQKLQLLPSILGPTRPIWMPKVPKTLLNERSAEYFYRTRSEQVKQDLDEYAQQKSGEHCWVEGKKAVGNLSEFVAEDGTGPFVEGKTVSYADFVIVGLLWFLKRVDEADFARLMEGQKPLQDLLTACEPWLQKDD